MQFGKRKNSSVSIWIGMMAVVALVAVMTVSSASAGVSAEEAEQLNTTLTPFGAEKAGNADGTIPAWEGGFTDVPADFDPNKKRPDYFAEDEVLFTITAKNMDQYADKLSEGTKAMMKKYPKTFKLNVYKTRRTAAAPQWVYDNTFKNATRGKMNGDIPENVYGGTPFPIPKTGAEAIWNHLLAWGGASAWAVPNTQYLITSDGRPVLLGAEDIWEAKPYYKKEGSIEDWNGSQTMTRFRFKAPPARNGEGLILRDNVNPAKESGYSYFPGQRRVRQIPSPCCDTPNPGGGGLHAIDEVYVFRGRITRFDWKIVEKKEMYIPYNQNRLWEPSKCTDMIVSNHLNPEYQRWELHRVWVIDATLRDGQRHTAPKSRYYLDEDSWQAALGERYDANGEMWKALELQLISVPEGPALNGIGFVIYDVISGVAIFTLNNEVPFQVKLLADDELPPTYFTPEAMAAGGLR